MEQSKKAATVVGPLEGTSLAVVGGSYRIVIPGSDTGGAYAVIEMLIPPGGGPGPHAHAGFEETFHILDGEIELKTELGGATAGKGTFVSIPKGGLVHCFKNNTQQVARLWCVVVPAGLDAFFQEIASPAPFGEFVAAAPMTPELMKKLQGIAEKYGQQLFPPDYLG